jgi:hypothetical protein
MMYILIILLLIVHVVPLRTQTANINVIAFDKLSYKIADVAYIILFSYTCYNNNAVLEDYLNLTRDDIFNINMTQTYQGQNITYYDSDKHAYTNINSKFCYEDGDYIYISIRRFKMKISIDLNIIVPDYGIPVEMVYDCKALDKFCSINSSHYMIWEYNNKPNIISFDTKANMTELETKIIFVFEHNDLIISVLIDSKYRTRKDYIMTNLPQYIIKIININKPKLAFKNKLEQRDRERDLKNINARISSKKRYLMDIESNITVSKEIYSKLMNNMCETNISNRLEFIISVISFIINIILFIYYFGIIKIKVINIFKRYINQDHELTALNAHPNRPLPNVP